MTTKRCAWLIVGASVLGACSGSEPTSTPATAGPAAVTTVPATEPAEPSAPASAPPSSQAVDDAGAPTAFAQIAELAALEETTELDLALAEFSALFGPIPGGPNIVGDDSIYPSATGVLTRLEEYRDELTDAQRDAIDAALDDVFGLDKVVSAFYVDDGSPAVSGFSSAHRSGASVSGTPNSGASAIMGRPAVPAPPRLVTLANQAAQRIREHLGGGRLSMFVALVEPGTRGIEIARNSGLEPGSTVRADWAADGFDANCAIQISDIDISDAELAGVLTHEMFHCWHFHQVGLSSANYRRANHWVMEGIAGYVGEELGGETRYRSQWWAHFVVPMRLGAELRFPLYRSTYDAIGFWSRVAEGTDIWATIPRVIDATVTGTNADVFATAVADLGSQISWMAAGVTQRPDWGPGWTATGPGMITTPRSTLTHEVTDATPVALSEKPANQRSHTISVTPVADADATVMSIQGSGWGVVRVDPDDVVLPGGSIGVEYCLGACECPDGTSPFPPDLTRPGAIDLTAALMGGAATDTTLDVSVAAFDPDAACDEDEAPPVLGVPAGNERPDDLTGTWRASNTALTGMFSAVFADLDPADDEDMGVQVVTGDLLMTMNADGTGSLAYDDVTIIFEPDVPIQELTITGGGTFEWGVSDGVLQFQGRAIAFVASSPALGDFPLTIPETSVMGGGASNFVFSPPTSTLTLVSVGGDSGTVFFPTNWSRQ